ncbi:cadherin-like domain-containing protein, partial [Accumulibacter sp.]|uniref:cadherin-like domain-containing protein n=1 Tax=Accumulibacter sp. TaxID=2053492 RepID=UPI002B9924E1
QTLAIAAPGLLANDYDPDGDALSVTSIDITGLQGSVTAFTDGHFNFTPSAGFSGFTSFSYNISDGFGGVATGTVGISVANGTPWAMDDHYTTRPGQTLAIAAPGLLANDNDPDGDALLVTSIDITGLQGSVTAFADGHFNFTPSAGFSGLTSFSYNISDGFGGTGTATAIIDVAPLLTVTRSIGDAPERQSGAGGQWAAAWTNSAIVNAITHKADVTNIGESWSAVRLSGLSPQTLAGGDIFNGDLGVSAQSVASSSVRQEIDGREGLRLDLAEAAAGLTVYLSRLFAQDDGGSFFESGRVRLLDAAGLVVKEGVFHAANLTGRQTLTLDSDIAFSTVEITAGVYNAAGSFVHGGYALADGSFASEVSIDALGGKHGSDFLIDKIDFQVPVAGVPLEVFLA